MSDERTVFRNVIVGVDGRKGGRDAIALARILVGAEGHLMLAHVHSGGDVPTRAATAVSEASPAPSSAPTDGERIALDDGSSQRLLESERERADVEARLVSVGASSIGHGLHQLAEREEADLVVVGSSRRGLLGRVFIGDDTRVSLNGAPCAIAVAPVGYTQELGGIRTIGVGYDGSAESEAALALARKLAAERDATVHALKVVQILSSAYAGFGGVAWGDALESVLAEAKQQMGSLEGVQGDATLGVAGEELAAFGERVDLLIVGSRGYGPVKTLMLGSTSQYLAGHARCPLLVLPRVPDSADSSQAAAEGPEEPATAASS